MLYNESSEIDPKLYGNFRESNISKTVRDVDKATFLQSGFLGSYRGSNFAQTSLQIHETNLVDLSPQKSKAFEPTYGAKKMNLSDVLVESPGTSDKQNTKVIAPSPQLLRTSKRSSSRSPVKRPSAVNQPNIHGETLEKHKLSKVLGPSSPDTGRVNRSKSGSPETVIVERSHILVTPLESKQKHKVIYPSGQNVKTENVPSVQIGGKRPKAKEMSRQSIAKKTKYDVDASPKHSKLRFWSSPDSDIAVEFTPKVSPSIQTEPAPKSATAHLQAETLSAVKTLLDDISTLIDNEGMKRGDIDEKRVNLPDEPEQSEGIQSE